MESRIESSGRESLRLFSALETRKRIELSELYCSRSLIKTAHLRLNALLPLIQAARKLDMCSDGMEREALSRAEEIDDGLEALLLPALRPGPRRASFDAGALQDLVRSFVAREDAALHTTRSLLVAGRIDTARDFAKAVQDPGLRYRACRLAETGTWAEGGRREFVAPAFKDADFPNHLPRFITMARCWTGEGESARKAERLLSSLTGRDRQIALAHWAAAAWRVSGLESGRAVIRSIRYESSRELARLLILSGCLAARRMSDAWRLVAELRGAYRERAFLLLATAASRQGRFLPARKLLGQVRVPVRQREKALALAQLHLHAGEIDRARAALRALRRPTGTKWEDLSLFDETLPRLETRLALGSLRACFAHEDENLRYRHDARDLLAVTEDPAALRCLVAELFTKERDPLPCLRWLRRRSVEAAESVWSEYLTLRCAQLNPRAVGRAPSLSRDFSEAFSQGLRIGEESVVDAGRRWSEATETPRCAYDEGVSWSGLAEQRREVLNRAAIACLKSWTRGRSLPAPAALRSRLRSLMSLGREQTGRQLARVLESVQECGPVCRAAFSALAALESRCAARLFFRHLGLLLVADPETARSLLHDLEDHLVIDGELTRLWVRVSQRLRNRLGVRATTRWLKSAVEACTSDSSGTPELVALKSVLEMTSLSMPDRFEDLVRDTSKCLRRAFQLPTEALVRCLCRDPRLLKGMIWLMPAKLSPSRTAWSVEDWLLLLRRMSCFTGKTDVTIVRRFADAIAPPRKADALTRRWLLGRFPMTDQASTLELGNGGHRLRYLDKRTDLLSFLRFADCVPCCFNSNSTWFHGRDMAKWVLLLWKDPLSFCFHVERRVEGRQGWSPCGFVFGGYAVVEGCRPALLLNGIYLKKQQEQLRFAILDAIETAYCGPLGIRWVALAAEYGGEGPLPKTYALREFSFYRFRGLRTKEGPVNRIYDDLTYRVNETVVESHLYWRML